MVSRRGFIASSAAIVAWLVPSWRLFKQRRTIDLTPFCDDYVGEFTRYRMNQPFAQDGQVYATDGRVCVRTTLADAPELAGEVRLPPASRLPWWANEARWRPYPRQQWRADVRDQTCPLCAGKGGLAGLAKCIRCEGTGEDEPAEYYGRGEEDLIWPACRACRGTGWTATVLCDYCGGKGDTDRPTIQVIDDLCFAGQYDHKIRALGDSEYAVIRGDGGLSQSGETVLAFRGDGFEGLLMPLMTRPWELRQLAGSEAGRGKRRVRKGGGRG